MVFCNGLVNLEQLPSKDEHDSKETPFHTAQTLLLRWHTTHTTHHHGRESLALRPHTDIAALLGFSRLCWIPHYRNFGDYLGKFLTSWQPVPSTTVSRQQVSTRCSVRIVAVCTSHRSSAIAVIGMLSATINATFLTITSFSDVPKSLAVITSINHWLSLCNTADFPCYANIFGLY